MASLDNTRERAWWQPAAAVTKQLLTCTKPTQFTDDFQDWGSGNKTRQRLNF